MLNTHRTLFVYVHSCLMLNTPKFTLIKLNHVYYLKTASYKYGTLFAVRLSNYCIRPIKSNKNGINYIIPNKKIIVFQGAFICGHANIRVFT